MPGPSRRQLLQTGAGGLAWALLSASLAGCAARRAARRAIDSREETLLVTVDAVRGATAPFALRGRFSVRLDSPGASGTVQGAAILHQPDRFRIELLSPFGTPLLYVASDGRALHAFSHRDGRFFRGDDAARVLGELTGGAVGLADVNRLLTGLLPLPEAPLVELYEDEAGLVRLTLEAPEDVRILAALDPKEELVRELRVVRLGDGPPIEVPGVAGAVMPAGETLVEVAYTETMRVGRDRLPEDIRVSLPSLGWTLDLAFQSWDALGQIPEVFELAPPDGAVEQDLVQTLKDLAERQGSAGG